MAADTATVPLTVRIPSDLYEATRRIAVRRKLSMNALMQQSLARTVESEEERELFEGFERLGEDPEACDVSFAFAAQSEVALRNEY